MNDVYNIVMDFLAAHGYDGLVNDDNCACLAPDLAPCGQIDPACSAGWRVPCDCGEQHDWHITTARPAPPEGDRRGQRSNGD